jgi:hypothetical protein
VSRPPGRLETSTLETPKGEITPASLQGLRWNKSLVRRQTTTVPQIHHWRKDVQEAPCRPLYSVHTEKRTKSARNALLAPTTLTMRLIVLLTSSMLFSLIYLRQCFGVPRMRRLCKFPPPIVELHLVPSTRSSYKAIAPTGIPYAVLHRKG